MSQDKRSSPRVTRSIDIECHTMDEASAPVQSRISDLSATGAFLDCLNPLPVGTRLGMTFTINERRLAVAAEVVHSMPQFGMGVRFLDASPELRASIERLLAQG